MALNGRTIVITGSTRGIGRAIALRCARDGANIVVSGKSDTPNPQLPGTIFTVAEEVERAGGKALAVKVDVRFEEDVDRLFEKALEKFGQVDALVNNAGALFLAPTLKTPMKRFDLVHQINVRATFMCTQKAIPHLRKTPNPHVLNLSPPLSLNPKWHQNNVAYSLSKLGMTLCTLSMAAEFAEDGISINSLWPRKMIATAATRMLLGEEGLARTRTPEIMAEAAYHILSTPRGQLTGSVLLDEDFLRSRGIRQFSHFSMDPKKEPLDDYYVD